MTIADLHTSSRSIELVIDQMALLLSQQKLVPFFGAGLSRGHLGFAAAELAHEMARRVGVSDKTLLSDVSDLFADKFGEGKFVDYLKSKLVVTILDDSKVSAHHLLLSLSPNLLYTTNQDNLFELTAEKYGRRYRSVVTLDDLSEALPGDRLLVKFHGDTSAPTSLVFGTRSYQDRIAAIEHPLDIRLKSDLLGKQLLFLGYSFSDENVAKLLDSVRRAFAGKLPPSYLLAYEYDASMEALSGAYGVTIINPLQLFPAEKTSGAAFERYLKTLCDCTCKYQARRGLENMFSGDKINPRIATAYEVDAVAKVIETESFDLAVKAFRGEFDHTRMPEHLLDRVMALFRDLTDKVAATDDKQVNDLRGALFNFHVPAALAVQAVGFFMAICNRRPIQNGYDNLTALVCPAAPDGSLPASAAMAVAVLLQRNEPITENFRRLATFWFDGWEDSPVEVRKTIQQMIEAAWQGSGSSYRQLNRAGFPRKGFHQILDDLQNTMAKRFKNPDT
jgi:hypothetical protein